MNPLQRTTTAIGAQLKALPTTARLLIGSLMVILLLSLFLVAQLAGRPEMVALPISLDGETRGKAMAYLERADVRHEQRDGRLLVPADQKYTVLAQLAGDEVIRGDQINFDSLIEQDSPFLTREQHHRRWLIAKMNVLSAMISRFDGVQRATVVIDMPQRRGFGSSFVSPSASVNITPRGEGLSRTQVEAIAHLVAGAQPGLKAGDVQVIDSKNGRRHRPRSDDEITAARYLEIKSAAEQHVKNSIEELLAYIPGVRIAVNAMVDTREVERRTDTYEDPKVGPLRSSRRTVESTTRGGGAEPGIRPNTGVAIGAAGGGSQLSDERSAEATRPVFPRDARRITDHKGYALQINAAIGVPRSYFLEQLRRERGEEAAAAATDAELEPVVTAETGRIRAAVEPLVDTGAFQDARNGTVVVSMIPDATAPFAAAGPPPSAPGGPGPAGGGGLGHLIRYIGLLALALLSLAMMFLMVRKAGPVGEAPAPQDTAGGPPPLAGDSEVVGEADESSPALEGVEIDDAALRRRQMLAQISDMVKQNPDEVAGLLRRWIRVEA